MCYPLPGPRCYNHAVKDYQKALLTGDPEKIGNALTDLERTPTAIAAMRRAGEHDRADKAESERELQINLLKQSEKKMLVFGESKRIKQATDPTLSPDELDRLASDESLYVRRGVAGNPSTPSEVLSRLVEDQDLALQQEIARNHNTPPEMLARMLAGDVGGNYVEDGRSVVLFNPGFDTSAVHSALDLTEGSSHYAASSLADHSSADDKALRRIYSILEGKTLGDDLPTASKVGTSRGISEETKQRSLESMAANPNLTASTREYLRNNEHNPNILKGLAANPASTPEELATLYNQFGNWQPVRAGLLKNHKTPENLVREMTHSYLTEEGRESASHETLSAVAANPRVSKEVLRELLNETSISAEITGISAEVGANPAWTAAELRQIGGISMRETETQPVRDHSRNSSLIGGILRNPNVPSDVVEHLAHSDVIEVREKVARSPQITPSAADILINTKTDLSSRYAVLRNPHLPSEYLESFQGRKNLSHPAKVMRLLAIAANPNASRKTLAGVMRDVHEAPDHLTQVLSRNPSLPPHWKVLLQRQSAA